MATKMNREPIEKMVYIRNVTTLADDDNPDDSVMIPVSMLRGFAYHSAIANTIIVYFELPYQYVNTDAGNNSHTLITVSSGTVDQWLQEFAIELDTGENPIITLGDDVTSEYFSTGTAILAMSYDVTDD